MNRTMFYGQTTQLLRLALAGVILSIGCAGNMQERSEEDRAAEAKLVPEKSAQEEWDPDEVIAEEPNAAPSGFTKCGTSCPAGYHATKFSCHIDCGPVGLGGCPNQVTCEKN
jgi:hypothetical protein